MSQLRAKSFNYAIGMFGTSIPINMLKTYAAIYYVDKLGVTTTQFALMLLIYTFIDALDNPIYGFLSDRTRTRWGRRRPWLTIGTPLLILTFVAFYSTPEFLAGNSLFAYCMLFYILAGTLDSVINANYAALFPELFHDDDSRATTNAMRQAFQLVAMIISIALTPMVTQALGYSLTSIVYGILGGTVILYMTFTCQEVEISPEEEVPQLWQSLKDLFSNRKFWVAGFANAFYSAAMALVLASMPFYVKYALELSESQSTFLFAAVLLIAIAVRGRLGQAGQKILTDACLASGLGHAGSGFCSALLCQLADHRHHLCGFGRLWICRGDHDHGFDRCQNHGRRHPKTRSAARRHHLQRPGIHEPAKWPFYQYSFLSGLRDFRL